MSTKLSNVVRDKIILAAVTSLIGSSRDEVIREVKKNLIALMEEVYRETDLVGVVNYKDFIRFSRNIYVSYDITRDVHHATGGFSSLLGYTSWGAIKAPREYPCFKGNSNLEFPSKFATRVRAIFNNMVKSALAGKSIHVTIHNAVYGVSSLKALVDRYPELKPFTKDIGYVPASSSVSPSDVSTLFKKS
jgi:hypothetical protein